MTKLAVVVLSASALTVPGAAQGQAAGEPEVLHRPLYFKLPLTQPRFHWRFQSPEAYLDGSLTLTIRRGEHAESIVVFEDGVISDGWQAIDSHGTSGIYFGFRSTARYSTAPGDEIDIELIARRSLVGQGPELAGYLPAGSHQSTGKFTRIIPSRADSTGPLAFIGCWGEKWDLVRIADGSLSPEEVSRNAQREAAMLEQLEALRSMAESLGASDLPQVDVAADGTPCG